ncbi:hypothetical protein TNIN_234561 [Trichonephila inaurata madagascariensis]|uniref:Uncharacterized protein n=1 Tax=Trichonephila inaurata madagascariensis TaxID=2747483 RepID=A0A8X6X1W2_9ARAC|nr:hypothetical protein TNIN_234561 [Trichonephila inaurata madagascariensis]
MQTLSPTPSVKAILAIETSKRKQKRVQSKTGEVLINENVLERLAAEENDRKNKFHQCYFLSVSLLVILVDSPQSVVGRADILRLNRSIRACVFDIENVPSTAGTVDYHTRRTSVSTVPSSTTFIFLQDTV